MKKTKIVYLYSIFAGYVESVVKIIAEREDCHPVDVIHWEKRGKSATKYELRPIDNVNFHNRADFDEDSIFDFLSSKKPDIVYVSGWMDRDYIKALKRYKKKGAKCKVVCGIDDQWEGTIRQLLGRVYFRFAYKRVFDFMWVAGKPQYHYARKFGYNSDNIISNLLSAEPQFFNVSDVGKARRFVFVGRLDPVKGIDLLISAYNRLSLAERNIWSLVIIGSGELEQYISENRCEGLIHIPFTQRDELLAELSKGGVGCVASTHEQWGVVIHEFSALGYPMLLSKSCGASSEFLIDGFNGYAFDSGSVEQIYSCMKKMIYATPSEIEKMSNNSILLSKRITPYMSVNSLLSIREK